MISNALVYLHIFFRVSGITTCCYKHPVKMVRSARRVALVLCGVGLVVLVLHQLTSHSVQLCTTGAGGQARRAPLKEVRLQIWINLTVLGTSGKLLTFDILCFELS